MTKSVKIDHDDIDDFGNTKVDFETAITQTKFGKFNIFLFILSIPGGWTNMLETSTMSYVFPAAHCDLNLSLNDRGLLNAMAFIGMITSGFLWGFLCDILGRKNLLVVGYLSHAVIVTLSSLSQNYTSLLVFKFLGGLIINGPFSALTAYLSEFHCSKYRSKVQLFRGIIVSCGGLLLPLLAMLILPQSINYRIFNNDMIVIHSWNIFILIFALPSLISGIIYLFMPESPKFLMTVGKNDEALRIFQKVYSYNTGKPKEEFPLKKLVDEISTQNSEHGGKVTADRSNKQALKEGFQQIKPLFFPPHLKNVVVVCLVHFLIMLTVNTLRLWLPQIFQSISDYQYYNNGTTSSLCQMLTVLNIESQSNITCHVNFSSSVYGNAAILAIVTIIGYIIASFCINRIGKKTILNWLLVIGGICIMGTYFAQNSLSVVALSSLFLSMGAICGNIMVTIVIDLFPTTLRTVTISLVFMLGRTASILGNLIFPLLLAWGCAPPFFFLGAIFTATPLLVFLIPNTEMKALK